MLHSSVSEVAYAKVNLTLHLIERLPDGYHALDSLVAFVDVGDQLQATLLPDGELRLVIDGEYGRGLPNEDNLIIRAAQRLQQEAAMSQGAALRLSKQIPVGAGLGGGSADAAATLRLLNHLWGLEYSPAMLAELGSDLGADIPACVFSVPTRMEGIGDQLHAMPHIPAMPLVLLYPNAPLWTPEVYAATAGKPFSGQLSGIPTIGASKNDWLAWLHTTHNDLEPAACSLSTHIQTMLDALLAMEGCALARMSGSGSACFGVFDSQKAAVDAAQIIQNAQPNWWVRVSQLLTM
jgi:4-diphosphocytidyl-2-C-methyl-D-erythritol kinase